MREVNCGGDARTVIGNYFDIVLISFVFIAT